MWNVRAKVIPIVMGLRPLVVACRLLMSYFVITYSDHIFFIGANTPSGKTEMLLAEISL